MTNMSALSRGWEMEAAVLARPEHFRTKDLRFKNLRFLCFGATIYCRENKI